MYICEKDYLILLVQRCSSKQAVPMEKSERRVLVCNIHQYLLMIPSEKIGRSFSFDLGKLHAYPVQLFLLHLLGSV